MRRLVPYLSIAMLLCGLSVPGPRPAAAQSAALSAITSDDPLPAGVRFLHVAASSTLNGDLTVITNTATNNHASALLFATHNYNPGGQGGQIVDRAVGAHYIPEVLAGGLGPTGVLPGQWALINEDATNFEMDLAYNLMVAPVGSRAFVHVADGGNTVANTTFIDNETWLNNSPDRIPFILHTRTPNGIDTSVQITSPLGIWYDSATAKWVIFAEDLHPISSTAAFNVMVGLPGATVFTHTATVGNTVINYTIIDHPLANGNPQARLIVTQNWNPTGALVGVYNNHHVGVFYENTSQRWTIYNEDGQPMPEGAGFNVLIDEAKVYLPAILR